MAKGTFMQKYFGNLWKVTALAICVFPAACVTRGKDFSSDLGWIKKNQTSQSDVQKYLGAPTAVGSAGGVQTWTYGFYNYRLFGESSTKELKFYWGNDFKVQDYSFNSSLPEDRRRLLLDSAK
jgi:hypothetical protein